MSVLCFHSLWIRHTQGHCHPSIHCCEWSNSLLLSGKYHQFLVPYYRWFNANTKDILQIINISLMIEVTVWKFTYQIFYFKLAFLSWWSTYLCWSTSYFTNLQIPVTLMLYSARAEKVSVSQLAPVFIFNFLLTICFVLNTTRIFTVSPGKTVNMITFLIPFC